jgi:hypothetical protein
VSLQKNELQQQLVVLNSGVQGAKNIIKNMHQAQQRLKAAEKRQALIMDRSMAILQLLFDQTQPPPNKLEKEFFEQISNLSLVIGEYQQRFERIKIPDAITVNHELLGTKQLRNVRMELTLEYQELCALVQRIGRLEAIV